MRYAQPSNFDFYATLLASATHYLWLKEPLPTNASECHGLIDRPLSVLMRHLLTVTKLPLEQFYMALKIVQVLTASFPDLAKSSSQGSEIRVFVASLIVANKYYEDHYISKRSWARVSSMTLQELNRMELEVLDGLRWNLVISLPEYKVWIRWADDLQKYWTQVYGFPTVRQNSLSSIGSSDSDASSSIGGSSSIGSPSSLAVPGSSGGSAAAVVAGGHNPQPTARRARIQL